MLEVTDIMMKLKDFVHSNHKDMGVIGYSLSFETETIYIDISNGKTIIVTFQEAKTIATKGEKFGERKSIYNDPKG